ncbi:hypothetical protein IQ249_18575 [Lusitaniella coriacea LEGE 07157]|uniref:Uncharacterized protein n=1 Tax=Lusitaniella coriacea LEGE 07157 TaxID=945747 RepID=A0A8J7DYM0_9CYAN|nr:hypothetical protein [Lusitaniella coriacea]MBE9117906.1 hypothetical protein [Lusitaniella coriacea LEGE 07157]
MPEDKASQSQSFTNSPISGQVGQGRDFTQIQSNPTAASEQQISVVEVVELLDRLKALLDESSLPAAQKETAEKYLEVVKAEANKPEPNKELAAMNLKQVTETLKNAGSAVDVGKSLWQKVQPMIVPLITWLGVATNFFLG